VESFPSLDDLRKYGDIFIKVHEWGKFKHPDIEGNDIIRISDMQDPASQEGDVIWMTAPHFVTNFERKLERKPCLQSQSVRCFLVHLLFNFDGSVKIPTEIMDIVEPHFDLPSVDPTTEDEFQEETRYAQRSEVLHTAHHVVEYEWEKSWQGTHVGTRALKEHVAKSIFFDPLLYTPRRERTVTVLQYVLTFPL
jgi:hypothetical protein